MNGSTELGKLLLFWGGGRRYIHHPPPAGVGYLRGREDVLVGAGVVRRGVGTLASPSSRSRERFPFPARATQASPPIIPSHPRPYGYEAALSDTTIFIPYELSWEVSFLCEVGTYSIEERYWLMIDWLEQFG